MKSLPIATGGSSLPCILLCGPSVRAFAQSATRAGFRVVAVDDFGDLDLAEIADEVHPSPPDADGYVDLFASVRPDAWCYGGGWENRPDLVERLSKIAPLWGTGAPTLRELRDPFRWSAALRDRGIDVPEVRRPDDPLPDDGRRWLSKRADGANGSHVRWAEEVGESDSACRYLQEYVPGQVESVAFVAFPGGLSFLGACRQIVGAAELGASGFGFAGAVGPLDLPRNEAVEFFLKLGDAVNLAFPWLTGLFGVDGVRTGDGRWLPIEINPRYTASMEIYDAFRDQPLFHRHAAACSGEPATYATRLPDRRCLAKGILYAPSELSLSFDLAGWRRFEQQFPGVRLADLPRPGTLARPGDPVLTLLVEGPDVDAAQSSLFSAAVRVREELLRQFSLR